MILENTSTQQQKQSVISHKTTIAFSSKDNIPLKMDVYSNHQDLTVKEPCVLFLFGGGFMEGQRDSETYAAYFIHLVSHHYKVVAIDYRLGLKGVKTLGPLHTQPLKNAIDAAIADLYDATAYLIEHSMNLGIDTTKIIISGTSAGAITVLQADWEKRNQAELTRSLPKTFQYAGVISFSGAILSYKGGPVYPIPPAPTMMFHGTEDKLVTFDKRRFFNKGFFGSNYLAQQFRKNKYPYYFQKVQGMGHEVAVLPMTENLDDITWFLDNYVFKKKQYLMDVNFQDLQQKRTMNLTPEDVYH